MWVEKDQNTSVSSSSSFMEPPWLLFLVMRQDNITQFAIFKEKFEGISNVHVKKLSFLFYKKKINEN